jgi:hypothetical protein
MARKSNRKPVQKTTTEQRRASNSVSTPAIHTVSKMVEILKPWELSETNRHKTYQMMLQDDAVWSSVESRITSIEVAQSKPKLQFNKNSERSVWLKGYLEYCISNMKKSPRQVGRDCAEMVYNGIAPFEVVSKIEKSYPEYKGLFVLDDLIYIDPLTLDKVKPFVTEDGGRKVTHWRQLISAFRDTSGQQQQVETSSVGAVPIDVRKIATASYSASSGRPLGASPLDAAYTAWREKGLIQDYLLMGVERDLSGLPVLKLPLSLFEQAKDPNSEAYATVSQLTEQMANLHSSDASYMILPSDGFSENGSGSLQYDVSFKGVEGNDKAFDLPSIIEQKKKAIYTVLGASDLIAGENGGGSYNLLEGKAAQKAYYAQRDNIIIEDMWNKTIIPLLLRLNGFTDELESDIPVYKSGDVEPLSAEEQGKFAQRVASVGMMPLVPETVNHFLKLMGTTYQVPEDMTTTELREIMSNYVSNAGEGDGTSGTGDTQSGGASSDLNSENAS